MTDTFPTPEEAPGAGTGDAAEAVASAEAAVATVAPSPEPAAAPVAPAAPAAPSAGDPRQSPRSIELLQGVEMSVTVELGRTRLLMRDLLGLRAGSVVELDRPAGSPVDILVNGTLLARGEVVVVDDELGVRITEIAGGVDQEA
jgi:flagellar motor switch protein FliN/FliY